MRKKKKYLPLYYKWLHTGNMPNNGLCNCFGTAFSDQEVIIDPEYKLFELMFPDNWKDSGCSSYWGLGDRDDLINPNNYNCEFTPLRQTIVLLMAAMNGEL